MECFEEANRNIWIKYVFILFNFKRFCNQANAEEAWNGKKKNEF